MAPLTEATAALRPASSASFRDSLPPSSPGCAARPTDIPPCAQIDLICSITSASYGLISTTSKKSSSARSRTCSTGSPSGNAMKWTRPTSKSCRHDSVISLPPLDAMPLWNTRAEATFPPTGSASPGQLHTPARTDFPICFSMGEPSPPWSLPTSLKRPNPPRLPLRELTCPDACDTMLAGRGTRPPPALRPSCRITARENDRARGQHSRHRTRSRTPA